MKKNNEVQSAVRLTLVIVMMCLGVFCALAQMPGDETKPTDQSMPIEVEATPTPAGVTPTPKAASKTPKKRKTPQPLRIADTATPLPDGPTPAAPIELKETPVGEPLLLAPTPTVPPGEQ